MPEMPEGPEVPEPEWPEWPEEEWTKDARNSSAVWTCDLRTLLLFCGTLRSSQEEENETLGTVCIALSMQLAHRRAPSGDGSCAGLLQNLESEQNSPRVSYRRNNISVGRFYQHWSMDRAPNVVRYDTIPFLVVAHGSCWSNQAMSSPSSPGSR